MGQLSTILLTWESLVDILEDLWTSEASSDASSFLSYFQSERFLYTCFMFKYIFAIFDPLSKIFQAIYVDLITAIQHQKQFIENHMMNILLIYYKNDQEKEK